MPPVVKRHGLVGRRLGLVYFECDVHAALLNR
jgi:hypothetical protein